MKLSVIVAFYNMRREAPQTLYSLSRRYQRGVEDIEYEVIAVDNGSTHVLPEDCARRFGDNFTQTHFAARFPSPCEAINAAVASADGDYVMCCIDGARILSPGIIRKTMQAARACDHPFIYTLGMHLGDKVQNESMLEGYNQDVEDALLTTIDWKANGYELFDISSLALSCRQGFFSNINESNCFTMRRDDYLAMDGFNEAFTSPGGGLCNLDIFRRAHSHPGMAPVMLLGEATFHQFHGGVATNVAMTDHPAKRMNDEYARINGDRWHSFDQSPLYFGEIPPHAMRFLNGRD